MSELRELQLGFRDYLRNDGNALPATVVSDSTASAAERLTIYAAGMHLRFAEVLGADFGTVRGLLGEAQFGALVEAYSAAYPSRHPSIRWFGQRLVEFLRNNQPWSGSRWLAEMTLFEWSKSELGDVGDSEAMTVDDVARLPLEAWTDLRPRPVAASNLIRLETNVVERWHAFDEQRSDPSECSATPQHWLLWRRDAMIHWRSLAADEAWAFIFCRDGGSFGELCASLGERVGEAQAPLLAAGFLKQWVGDGVVRR